MPAIVALAAHVPRPGDDVCHPGRNVLVTARAQVVLLSASRTDMPHDVGFAVRPAWSLDRLRAQEG